ncbi:hypothetical protein K3729_13675 [Rhodobacteraceae bacterium S2214]|nr:hypothetical protein K3729_13675 [Rhodobacteraceae bacterium S2214]
MISRKLAQLVFVLSLAAPSIARAECMDAQEMLDFTPAELGEAQPCNWVSEFFLRFNDISRSSVTRLDGFVDDGDEYYVDLRAILSPISDSEFERRGPLTRGSVFLTTLAATSGIEQAKRESYQAFLLIEYFKENHESINASEISLADEIERSLAESGLPSIRHMQCLVQSDVPYVSAEEILASRFYKNCIDEGLPAD